MIVLNMALVDVWWTVLLFIWLPSVRCDNTNLLFSCDLGTNNAETFCGMVQSTDDDFDWRLTSSSDKSDTGPGQDHTGNPGGSGRFLWADSVDGTSGSTAIISTPPFDLTNGEGWLTFYYYLYGRNKEDKTLTISVCEGGNTTLTISGNQGREWHDQNLTVSCGDTLAQITFTAQIGIHDKSDMAVDDIYLYDVETTTTTTTTTDTPSSSESSENETTDGNSNNQSTPSSNTTTHPGMTGGSSTLPSITTKNQTETPVPPAPRKGSNLALPLSLGLVAILFVAALIMIICFIQKRRHQPDKPIPKDSVFKYDNRAYNMGGVIMGNNSLDTRGNTASSFGSSTWRSVASAPDNTEGNGTLARSQQPNLQNGTLGEPGNGTLKSKDPESNPYFVLNPGRTSMFIEDEDEEGEDVNDVGDEENRYDPVALYDNKPGPYTYIDDDGTPIGGPTGGVDAGRVGEEENGYEPITIKDDDTGGYQVVDDSGDAVGGSGSRNNRNSYDGQSPYEQISIPEKPKSGKCGKKKTPVPAARKNVPPKPMEGMVDNVLYKPMNGEEKVDKVLYKPNQSSC